MESNKNEGDEHEQLRGSARKRKLNELTNDGDKTAAGEDDQPELEDCSSSKKNRQHEGNGLNDLELENLSREELKKLVQKQMMEAQKQMETAKKEAEESARKAEEFSQRIVNLDQEKAELHAELGKKTIEIVEMHKEVEEKSEQLAEKAKQIDALLMQLNESASHQHQMPPQEKMKIQLSLETWYDWLAFVPRPRLGQIIPMIGDRKFASIVQKFLHKYGQITIHYIELVAPYEEDPSGPHPRVRVWQNNCPLRFEMAEAQMPANIKNFKLFELSYFDQSVLTFMQKFQQNGLLDNVNLAFAANLSSNDIVQPVLLHILPLINGIVSINLLDSAQLVDFYDAGNCKEIHEMSMKMMEQTRVLIVRYDSKNLHADTIDLYCRWLYQPARAEGKSRQLFFRHKHVDPAPISLFIDRLKQDFLMATIPTTFLIRIVLPKAFQPLEAICLDNDKTKERLQTKIQENRDKDKLMLQISRHPLASTNKWSVGNEYYEKRISFSKELKVVAI